MLEASRLGRRIAEGYTRQRALAPPIRPWANPVLWPTLAVIALSMVFIDQEIAAAIWRLDRDLLDTMGRLSQVGNSKWYLQLSALTVGVALLLRTVTTDRSSRRVQAWIASAAGFLFVTIAASGILVNVFKILVGRARPRMLLSDNFYGFDPIAFEASLQSFPSGHANTVIALAVTLGLFIPRFRLWFFCLGVVFALGRVGANAHFLSDVIGGGALAVTTTLWLQNLAANQGLIFEPTRSGGYRLTAPGRLIGIGLRRAWRRSRAGL